MDVVCFSHLSLVSFWYQLIFYFKCILDEENNVESQSMISDQRSKKIMEFKNDSNIFESKIINFHNEKNSSLESAMQKITESYRPKPNKDQ